MSVHGGGGPNGAGPGHLRGSLQPDAALKKPASDVETQMREVAAQFEAVFIRQMLASMRATIPDSGLVEGGQAEELFAGMMDDHLSEVMASQSSSDLADAIYRQLRKGIGS